MKNVSSTFRSELNNDNRIFINSCIITLSDGIVLSIDNSKIWDSGFKIEDAVSGSNSFDLGSVIIGKFTVSLNNIYDEYSIYDFTDCVASNVKIGLELPDGTVESVIYGKYYINEPKYNGAVITLEFCDCLYKFDKDYSLSKLEYPATLGQIVMDACDVCGVQLGTTSFSHDDYVVQSRPEDSALTFRQVLQWVGEISCNFCKADSQGRLSLSWYDTETLESLNRFDGGMFSPWIAGESIDGGAFDPWGTGDTFDGGSLLREDAGYHYIKSFSTLSLSTDDVVVTGVRVVQKSSDDNGSVSYQSGSDGYVISVEENKLIQGDMGNTVASMLGEKLIGLRFRPFTASCLSDPTIESGDIAVIMDVKGNFYNTVITSNMFQPGSYQNISCGAKTPARNSATRYSKITQVYVDYRKDIQKERTEREKALDKLSERINVSSGFFTTTETKEDGSKIYYMHNKPLLSESDIVWKMTAETWSVSTDGGETWNAGITVDGDTIVRILNAEGVNADWVRTGTLVVKDADGNILFSADMDTGKVIVSGDSVHIGDKTVTKALEEIEKKTDQATALSIVLDNDYQGIPADYEGNISTFPNVKTTVTVLYGHTDVSGDCTYTVTKSSGITGSWDSSTRTYSVIGLVTDTGWVDITAVYLGVFTVTKRFTVSKVKGGVPGQDGLNGQDGTDGVGISSVDVQYYKSTSATSLTGGSWSTTNPGWENGKYIWSKTVITYTDGSTDETTAVCVTGAKGSTGSTGAAGSDGEDGVGVESIVEQYYQSTSATSLTGGSWSTTYPGWVDGKYIWTRSVITYTDNTTTTTTAVCVTGSKGATGATGNGISSITEYYAVSSSNSTAPTSWQTTVPTMTTTNKYLWNYETIKYTDNTTKDTTKRVIGVYGNTGASGADGEDGADGKGISSITNYYLATASSTGVATSTSGWTTTVQSVTSTKKYLWNYEVITYTDSTSTTTTPCIIGVYGDKGDTGATGATGVGISKVTNYYLATASSSGITTSTSGWTTTVQSVSSSKKYLWNYEVVTYTDNSTAATTPCIIGAYGDTGATGETGATGADGKGISSIAEKYAVSSSNSTAPTTWYDSVQTMTTTNKYLWNYEIVTYTDGTTSETAKRVIGVYGNTGATGSTGATGADGKGISSITNYYLTTSASSGVTTSTSGWSTTPTATTTTNKYLWNYEKITYTDNTTVSTSPCIIGVYGDKGDAGIPGRVYELSASTLAIKKGADNVLTPSSVTFSGFYRDGNSATRSLYSGRFKIEESTDGNTFTTKYTSSANESAKSYTPSSSDVKVIRCTLYAAGGTTNALDLQSVVVLTDVDALTHEEIFNLLTNNGVVKGIYKEGDQLYISFTYAKGGELSLGGSNNKNGALRVYDENDEIFALIDMDNFLIKAVPQQLTTYDSFQMRRLIGMIKPAIEFKSTHSSSSDSDHSVLINDIITICNSNDADKIIGDLLPNTSDPYIYMNENGLFWKDAGGSLFSAATLIKSSVKFPDAAASFKSLSVSGTKSRISNTENYNNRLLYCYEMPSPMFGDIGEGTIDENGECYICLDDVFSETVSAQIEYQVFIQKEGQGDIWVDSKEPAFFVVKGTPNLKFAWEVKVKQKGYEYDRLETFEREEQSQEIDYETEYMKEINQIITEQEDVLYSTDK